MDQRITPRDVGQGGGRECTHGASRDASLGGAGKGDDLVAALEGAFDEVTSDEAAGSGDTYVHVGSVERMPGRTNLKVKILRRFRGLIWGK
jgi:hypothetical protein